MEGWGECGYTLYERTTIRPALTVNGLIGGYQGPGNKSIIPACAVAKLNFRLVPDQDPLEIEQLWRQHVARLTPPTVRTTLRTHLAARPAFIDRSHPALRAAVVAYRQGFGTTPVFVRSGGTIPVVNTLPDDRMHAPNKKVHLPNFYRGIATCIWFFATVGAHHWGTRPPTTPLARQRLTPTAGMSVRRGGSNRDH